MCIDNNLQIVHLFKHITHLSQKVLFVAGELCENVNNRKPFAADLYCTRTSKIWTNEVLL